MKRILGILITILSLHVYAQDYSTIYFVTNFQNPNWVYNVYLNEQQIGTVGPKDNLEYKIYSEGRVTVSIEKLQGIGIKSIIEVKKGNTYYFLISPMTVKYGLIEEEKGKKFYEKNTNNLKASEDKGNPVIKPSPDEEGPRQGTCFLISKQGYLITNYHVISGAKSIQVKGIGNDFSTLYGVDVVAFDVDLDLALLKVKNQNLNFSDIPYAISMETNPQGTKSFVLGYPLTSEMGEEIKLTEGLISAKSGYKGTISQYQFSAAVQPGNSGSPLFNENGDVVGVINAKLLGAEGAGYAIKSQYVMTFLKLVEGIQIENNKSSLSNLPFTEKVSKLKNFIFIVKTE